MDRASILRNKRAPAVADATWLNEISAEGINQRKSGEGKARECEGRVEKGLV